MNTVRLLPLLLLALPLTLAHAAPAPTFSPSVGWAGTTSTNGTRVRILGAGFAADPQANQVFFFNGAKASIIANTPNDLRYQATGVIGSPGSGPGELQGPNTVAVDADGNVYVANAANARVEVFNSTGNYVRQLGNDLNLASVYGVAVDNTRKRLYLSGQKFTSGTGGASDWQNWVYGLSLATDPALVFQAMTGTNVPSLGMAINESTGDLYVASRCTIHKYAPDGTNRGDLPPPPVVCPQLDKWGLAFDQKAQILYVPHGSLVLVYRNDIPERTFDTGHTLYGIAVDWQGYIYVAHDLGRYRLAKYDSEGTRITEVDERLPGVQDFDYLGIAVNANKRIHAVTSSPDPCECVRLFSPADSSELLVTVPPGAQTGKITVQTPTTTLTSEASFTVLTALEPVAVNLVEITQGVWSYPLIWMKDTLAYIRVTGFFGHPAFDTALVRFTTPHIPPSPPTSIDLHPDHFVYDTSGGKTDTLIHFHVPATVYELRYNNYDLHVEAWRKGQQLVPPDQQNRHIILESTNPLNILFVKFTDVPEDMWDQVNPFAWFDMNTFFHGIATLKRTFPAKTMLPGLNYRIVDAPPTDLVTNLTDKTRRNELRVLAKQTLNDYLAVPYQAFRPTRVIGLVDNARYPGTGPLGWSTADSAVTFFSRNQGNIRQWGELVAHELGHTYGLVPPGKPNYVQVESGDHSSNQNLSQEQGAPITPWNALTDRLLTGNESLAMMRSGGVPDSDRVFFESRFRGALPDYVDVDYHLLFDALEYHRPGEDDLRLAAFAAATFVMLGSIDSKGVVTIVDSFVTDAEFPSTVVDDSEYSIVFLDSNGQVLGRQLFAVLYGAQDLGQMDTGTFEIAAPYPPATARVELRSGNRVLTQLVPSQTPPVVQDVTVEVPEFERVRIGWAAVDPDGDSLTYTVSYSADGGETFMPIAAGLHGTQFFWDDRQTGGSAHAQIKVTAWDGFHEGSGVSTPFVLGKKLPEVSIVEPAPGATVTEGSVIHLRGAGLDPEDGALDGESLVWRLDETHELGTGQTVMLQELPRDLPNGSVLLPVPVGPHTISLQARDSDGNQTTARIGIVVVADTDRDGVSDQTETEFGSDPYDPFVQPNFDQDGDAVPDSEDNCPTASNPDQADFDLDGDGDACDPDVDGDGVGNESDRCPGTISGDQVDAHGCSIAQYCPCEGPWKTHGAYVSCVATKAGQFVSAGLITSEQKDTIVSQAAQSGCGQKAK